MVLFYIKFLNERSVVRLMDVTCATCGEPWDIYHLQHDEVYETEAGLEIIRDELNLEEWERSKSFTSGVHGDTVTTNWVNRRNKAKPKPQYRGEPWEGKLTPFWRSEFGKNGWEFASSVYAVLKCPCCKHNDPLPNDLVKERKEIRTITADLLEGDDDGIASILENE